MAKRQVSDSHKKAMAAGRVEGRVVKAYLEALEENKPKRGRKRTPESIRKRLDGIEATIADSDPLKRLNLVQERIDLRNELASTENASEFAEIEKAFVDVAAGYSGRKGISYGAWREVGVPAATLKAAGIGRGAVS
ncbi:MAG: hypothetical protein GY812_07230 [Actinomycetia bacterium]|nr:hypothetical protein [Actinomycetes bacterium]